MVQLPNGAVTMLHAKKERKEAYLFLTERDEITASVPQYRVML